jgi:hypothetical protein
MTPTRQFRTAAVVLSLLGPLAGCEGGIGGGGAGASAAGTAPRPGYVREYVFLGSRQGEPLVVPFAFRAVNADEDVERAARAWLAHGARWEEFLDERWRGSATAGVWRVVPHGELKVAARGASELDALWFESDDRSLRLQIGAPISGWTQGENARFRVQQGRLSLGEEVVTGAVLQLLEVDRGGAGRSGAEPVDWIFLSGGDSLRLVLARLGAARDRFGTSFAWTGRADAERSWETAEIDPLEVRPLPVARRDIPLRWRFRVPGAGVHGEVRALGYDPVLGPEREGRRAVDVRYTVDGWVEVDGRRSRVQGTVRHSQR